MLFLDSLPGVFWSIVIGCGVILSIVDGVMRSTVSISVWTAIGGEVQRSMVSVGDGTFAVVWWASCSGLWKMSQCKHSYLSTISLPVGCEKCTGVESMALVSFSHGNSRIWFIFLMVEHTAYFEESRVEKMRCSRDGWILACVHLEMKQSPQICLFITVDGSRLTCVVEQCLNLLTELCIVWNLSISSNVESRLGAAMRWIVKEWISEDAMRSESDLGGNDLWFIDRLRQWIVPVLNVKSRMRKKWTEMPFPLNEMLSVNHSSEK